MTHLKEGMSLSFSWFLYLSRCHMNDYGMKYSFFQFVSAVLVLKLYALMFLLSLFLMKPCPKYNTACICISSVLLLGAISCSKNNLFFSCTEMLIFALGAHTIKHLHLARAKKILQTVPKLSWNGKTQSKPSNSKPS